MVYIISRKTSRELRDSLAESASKSQHPNVRGVVRRTEEAHDIERRLSKEGEAFERPFSVDANAPESVQARIELAERMGSKDPERDQEYM